MTRSGVQTKTQQFLSLLKPGQEYALVELEQLARSAHVRLEISTAVLRLVKQGMLQRRQDRPKGTTAKARWVYSRDSGGLAPDEQPPISGAVPGCDERDIFPPEEARWAPPTASDAARNATDPPIQPAAPVSSDDLQTALEWLQRDYESFRRQILRELQRALQRIQRENEASRRQAREEIKSLRNDVDRLLSAVNARPEDASKFKQFVVSRIDRMEELMAVERSLVNRAHDRINALAGRVTGQKAGYSDTAKGRV